MSKKKWLLATGNEHKVSEVREILGEYGLEILSFKDLIGDKDNPEIVEDGKTFYENAYIKASSCCKLFEGKIDACLADDSGLVVPALSGQPGIYSSRFAGDAASDLENTEKLLREMEGLKGSEREAYFHCSIVLVKQIDRVEKIVAGEGKVHGRIATSLSGNGGFGYDPVFIPEAYEQSFAELGDEIKNQFSHRRRALDVFINKLEL